MVFVPSVCLLASHKLTIFKFVFWLLRSNLTTQGTGNLVLCLSPLSSTQAKKHQYNRDRSWGVGGAPCHVFCQSHLELIFIKT